MILCVALLLAQVAPPDRKPSGFDRCDTAGKTTICHNDQMSVTCVRTGNVVKCETAGK